MNRNDETNLKRGIDGLRVEPVDTSRATGIANLMVTHSQPRPVISRPILRYLSLATAAVALGVIAFWPRPLSAASLKAVAIAVGQQPSRYEKVYKPDANGHLYVYMEQWGAPGKFAMRFIDGTEHRSNGKLSYSCWPADKVQRIQPSDGQTIDPVSVEDFMQFKLRRVVTNGTTLRYVFNIGQDLVVDARTNLVTERDVYNSDGSIMEVHEYHFQPIDGSIFDPIQRPGVTMHNIIEDRATFAAALARTPQSQVVDGITVNLHAVVVNDFGIVSAVLTGEDPPSRISEQRMEIPGFGSGANVAPPRVLTSTLRPLDSVTVEIGDKTARIQGWFPLAKTAIPDQFTLKIPVWKLDPKLPKVQMIHGDATEDSRLVGWAEFKVSHPIRTESLEKLLPGYNWGEGPRRATSTRQVRSGRLAK